MKTILSVLDEVGYRGLAGIALAVSVAISGASALLVGVIWVTWRLWDTLGLPTATIFKGFLGGAYWPAVLLLGPEARKQELSIVLVSFAGWFVALVVVLFVGRKIRALQGKTLP